MGLILTMVLVCNEPAIKKYSDGLLFNKKAWTKYLENKLQDMGVTKTRLIQIRDIEIDEYKLKHYRFETNVRGREIHVLHSKEHIKFVFDDAKTDISLLQKGAPPKGEIQGPEFVKQFKKFIIRKRCFFKTKEFIGNKFDDPPTNNPRFYNGDQNTIQCEPEEKGS